MILKLDAKFEEKLICCFKNDKYLVNFDLSTRNPQKFHSDWFLLCKVCNAYKKYLTFHLKKYRGVIFHDTEE